MTTPSPPLAAATLDELIEVLNDGINFFGDAAELSDDAAHAQLFRDLRADKRAIADALRAAAPIGAKVRQQEGSLSAALRQGYADLRSRLVREVARDGDVEGLLADQHGALRQVVGGLAEGVEGDVVDALTWQVTVDASGPRAALAPPTRIAALTHHV